MLSFFPIFVALGFLAALTTIVPPLVIYTSLLILVCLHLYIKKINVRQFWILLIFLSLIMAFLNHKTLDLRDFGASILFYGYPFVITWAFIQWKKVFTFWWLPLAALLPAFIFDISESTKFVAPLYNEPIPKWAFYSSEKNPSFYPLGMIKKGEAKQRIRYPEIITKDFNFVGNRFFQCEQVPTGKCPFNPKLVPYAFWTNFFVTREYVDLYLSDNLDRASQEIRGSFRQGVDFSDQYQVNFQEKPLCSTNGYTAIGAIHGEGIEIDLAGPPSFSTTLPILNSSHLKVTLTGDSQTTNTEDGLIGINSNSPLTSVEIRIGFVWKIVIFLFWLPFLALLIILLKKVPAYFMQPSASHERNISEKMSYSNSSHKN